MSFLRRALQRLHSASRRPEALPLSCLFVLMLHVTRSPWLVVHPPLYAEEGRVFFLDALRVGPASLLKTYAGYPQLFPRLVALILSGLPVDRLPVFYHLSALLAHAILLYAIVRFSEDFSPANRILMLFCSILLPHGGEVFLNLPNTIHFLSPVPLLLFLAPASRHRLHAVLDPALALLAALSGPYVVIFLPLMLLDAFVRRRLVRPVLIVAVLGTAMQLGALDLAGREPVERLDVIVAGKVFAAFFFPLFFWWMPVKLSASQTVPVILLGGFGLLHYARRAHLRPEWVPTLLILAGGLAWLASMLGGLGVATDFHPLGGAQRYFWVPYLLVSIGLAVWTRERGLRFVLVGAIFLSGLASWRSQMPAYTVEPPYVRVGEDGTVRVSVYPSPVWDIQFDPRTIHAPRRIP